MICHTADEIQAAARAAAAALGPLTQDQVDLAAAILATTPDTASAA